MVRDEYKRKCLKQQKAITLLLERDSIASGAMNVMRQIGGLWNEYREDTEEHIAKLEAVVEAQQAAVEAQRVMIGLLEKWQEAATRNIESQRVIIALLDGAN